VHRVLFQRPPCALLSPLFPYTTLFRSVRGDLLPGRRHFEDLPCGYQPRGTPEGIQGAQGLGHHPPRLPEGQALKGSTRGRDLARSEEHTSELQSPYDLVCRLLLEKKKY